MATHAEALEAVKTNWRALKDLSEQQKNNPTIVKLAVAQNGQALQHASEQLRDDRDFMLEAVKQTYYSGALKYASEQLRSDRGVVLEAVAQNGSALEYASEDLRGDRSVVWKACTSSDNFTFQSNNFEHASDELKGDRDFVLELVKQDCSSGALEYASEELRGDRGVVLEAVAENGSALEYASEELRGDRGVVLEAVAQNGSALKYASEELRGDRGVVLEAVMRNGSALEYASEELRGDHGIVLGAVKDLIRRRPDDGSGDVGYVGTKKGMLAACKFLSLDKRGNKPDLAARLEEWYEREAAPKRKKQKKQKTDGGLAEPVASTSGGAGSGKKKQNMGGKEKEEQSPAAPAAAEIDLSWLEQLPPRRLRPLCEQKGLSVGGNSEALAKRLRASGGLGGGQLKELCDAPEVGVASYGTKAQIARRIDVKLAEKAAATKKYAEKALAKLSPAAAKLSIEDLVARLRDGDTAKKVAAAEKLGDRAADGAEACAAIVQAGGIGPLVDLARTGSGMGKQWAAYALGHISTDGFSSNIFEAGGIGPLVELARSGSEDAKKWAASALGDLARLADASEAIKEADGVGALVDLVRSGGAHAKAWAAEGLGNLAGHGPAYCTAIRQADGEQALRQLSSSGGKKAKYAEKALAELSSATEPAAAPAAASGKKKLVPVQPAPGSKKQNMGSASPFPTMSRDEMVATHECLFGSPPGSNTDDDELRSRLIEFVKPHADGWKAALAAALHTSVSQFLTSCGRTNADAKRVASARLQSCSTAAAQRAMWDKLSSEYCPRAPAPPDRSSAGEVLVIAPGFGIMATPAQLRTLQRAYGSAVVCSNQHANPEEADFDMAAGILPILHQIKHHKPKAILCASKGSLYMRELWRLMEAGGHDHLKGIGYLMINAHPSLTQLPQGVKIILVQGAKEEKWPRPRGYLDNGSVVDSSLEALIRTGSPGMCYLYYTAEVNSNWGYRKGDTHVPTSLLLHDCLPRLVDSLLATSSPAAAFQASSRTFLSLERVAAENGLGWHPNTLRSRFVGTEDDTRVEVPPNSAEFRHVECIFKADPAPGVDRFYFPNRGTSDLTIAKIERVQNRKLKDSVDHTRGDVKEALESVGEPYVAGVHSRWLFHGTGDADALESIVDNPVSGFAPQMGLGNGGVNLWGYGSYFARDASYPVHAGYGGRCLDDDGYKMLLLCLVECGLSCVGEEHMRIMPKVHPTTRQWRQLTYNSYMDYASNPEIFVVGRGEQVYPAYIIHFS